ncbi:MAG TPA: class I SAM-dependent methyltransferase [Candidatus Bathyarchaeia archaeon]|nr:class I SAM-dependent methyltransferase [Candidatus Bathyarchaeia archaeon]
MVSPLKRIIKRNSVNPPPPILQIPKSVDSEPSSLEDYWENRLKENFGLHGAGYIGLGRSYNNWLYKVRRKVFVSRIKSMYLDFSDKEVLDVGCGTGFYLGLWKNKIGVRHITGIDITNIAIKKESSQTVNSIGQILAVTKILHSLSERRNLMLFLLLMFYFILLMIINLRRQLRIFIQY